MTPARLGLAFGLAAATTACDEQFAPDIILDGVELRATDDPPMLDVVVRNRGSAAAWVHAAPHRILVDDEDLTLVHVRLDGEDPPVSGTVDPIVEYARIVAGTNPVIPPVQTLEVELPSHAIHVGSDGTNTNVLWRDVTSIAVEVAWHDADPGEVGWSEAPEPTGVALGAWDR